MTRYVALSMKVLAVAKANEGVGDWAAYIDAVPGYKHSEEYIDVLENGEKLPKDIAEKLFPDYAEKFVWRH